MEFYRTPGKVLRADMVPFQIKSSSVSLPGWRPYISRSIVIPTAPVFSSILRIQDLREALERIHRIHSLAIDPRRLLPLLERRGSFRQRLVSQLFALLPRGAERVDSMRELIDGELEVLGDVA